MYLVYSLVAIIFDHVGKPPMNIHICKTYFSIIIKEVDTPYKYSKVFLIVSSKVCCQKEEEGSDPWHYKNRDTFFSQRHTSNWYEIPLGSELTPPVGGCPASVFIE